MYPIRQTILKSATYIINSTHLFNIAKVAINFTADTKEKFSQIHANINIDCMIKVIIYYLLLYFTYIILFIYFT